METLTIFLLVLWYLVGSLGGIAVLKYYQVRQGIYHYIFNFTLGGIAGPINPIVGILMFEIY